MKNNSIKTVVATGIGAALFIIVGTLINIPTPIPNTNIQLQYAVIALFAVIIIAKQIKLWFHEHHIRISILRLHGASVIYSATSILNYAMLSAFLSFIISSIFLFYVSHNMSVLFPQEIQEIVDIEIDLGLEIIKLFLLSFCISIFTIFGVLLKYKISND